MKCIKVDIKKEILDVDPTRLPLQIATRDLIRTELKETGKVTVDSSIERVTYFPRRVYNHNDNTTETYLVKLDEDNLFTDLMKVTQSCVDDQIQEAVKKLNINIWYIKQGMKRGFASLPWYKRLFYKSE